MQEGSRVRILLSIYLSLFSLSLSLSLSLESAGIPKEAISWVSRDSRFMDSTKSLICKREKGTPQRIARDPPGDTWPATSGDTLGESPGRTRGSPWGSGGLGGVVVWAAVGLSRAAPPRPPMRVPRLFGANARLGGYPSLGRCTARWHRTASLSLSLSLGIPGCGNQRIPQGGQSTTGATPGDTPWDTSGATHGLPWRGVGTEKYPGGLSKVFSMCSQGDPLGNPLVIKWGFPREG